MLQYSQNFDKIIEMIKRVPVFSENEFELVMDSIS